MVNKLWVLPLLGLILLAAACSATDEATTLRLMTHDSFDISQEVLVGFEEESGLKVEVFKAGDGGAMVTKAILAKDNPLADVLYGVDNTFLGRSLEHDIFVPYDSPLLAEVRPDLLYDDLNRVLPVDFGDVCLNYDKAWFEEASLLPPDSLADLIHPDYSGLTVVENPATSTPGLAFLLTTIEVMGEDGYLEYWQQLRDNGVLVTEGWEQAYYEHFSAASDGERPIVVSYASSPPAEVFFAEEPLDEALSAAVTAAETCFRQVEYVGILRGTKNELQAQALVDFMLGRKFQEDLPLHMFVYPANMSAELPQVFIEFSSVPDNPVTMDPQTIESNRNEWIRAWDEVVLR